MHHKSVWVTKTPSDSRVEKLGGIVREDSGAVFRQSWFAVDGIAGSVRQPARIRWSGGPGGGEGWGASRRLPWLSIRRSPTGSITKRVTFRPPDACRDGAVRLPEGIRPLCLVLESALAAEPGCPASTTDGDESGDGIRGSP